MARCLKSMYSLLIILFTGEVSNQGRRNRNCQYTTTYVYVRGAPVRYLVRYSYRYKRLAFSCPTFHRQRRCKWYYRRCYSRRCRRRYQKCTYVYKFRTGWCTENVRVRYPVYHHHYTYRHRKITICVNDSYLRG